MNNKEIKNINIEKDYLIGKIEEDKLFNSIKDKFNLYDLKQTTFKFAVFDYFNDYYYIELKSRNCNSNKYNDIFFNNSKIKYGNSKKKKMIFIFKFNDKIKYIEYNEDKFKNYKSSYIATRFDRNKTEHNDIVFIPINDMLDF